MSESPMAKLPDWQDRLTYLLGEVHRDPFIWGKLDCCLLAAAAVEAQTGVDLAEPFRGTYSDAAGAARHLRASGGLRGLGARVGPEVGPLMAQHGDVGIVRGVNGKPVMAVFSGVQWLAPTAAGIVALPPLSAIKCWRVGHG